MRAISSIIARITLALIGAILIYSGVRVLKSVSTNLIMTQAEIVASSVKYSDTGDKSYDISYRYEVNGEKFTLSFNSKNDYTLGSNIPVYYNPNSPDLSFRSMEAGRNEGIVFLLAGIFLVIFVARWEWKVRSQRRM